MEEFEVIIDTEDIENFLYSELIKRGYTPSENEVEDLADIVFDYLLSKDVIEEEDNI